MLPSAPTDARYDVVESPLGDLLLVGNSEELNGLYTEPGHRWSPEVDPSWRPDPGCFLDVVGQLRAYFAGELRSFSVHLAPTGTEFQLAVWSALRSIPYGATASYGDIARAVERPSASRAVGAANGRNPISIIVPCHRVIGANGRLVGYGGGLHRKEWLLGLEAGRHGEGSPLRLPAEGQATRGWAALGAPR